MARLAVFFIFLTTGVYALNGPVRGIDTPSGRFVRLTDVQKSFDCTVNGARLQNRTFDALLTKDSKKVCINGTQFLLTHPAMTDKNGNFYLAGSDVSRLLGTFFAKAPAGVRRNKLRIILDPGHGGSDPGAVRSGIMEKEMNLNIALLTADFLRKNNIEVIMTRDDDRTVSLEKRSSILSEKHGDIFVSIHHNASANQDAYGTETYTIIPGRDFAGSRFEKESVLLAHHIQNALVKQADLHDRGVRSANFHVLRRTDAPAVLVECAFLSNAKELERISSAAEQKRTAAAIADGILNFAGWDKK